MSDEVDGTNEIEWHTRYQVIVDEYYETAEEAERMADKISDLVNVATDYEEVETTF